MTGESQRGTATGSGPDRQHQEKEKVPSVLPQDERALGARRAARGDADVHWATGLLSGYILLPDTQLSSVQVYLDGVLAGSGDVAAFRPDVADFFRHIPHAGRSGFRVPLNPGQLKTQAINHLRVVGCDGGRPIARLETLVFPRELIPDTPTPPPELIQRTQGGQDGNLYKTLGFRYYNQLREAMARHREPRSVRRLLDWGCGSGRVAANFLAGPDVPQVCGCDIDPQAIAWCRAHLQPGEFTQVDGSLPLPYPDASFDAVVVLALLAGFGPDAYAAWLPELRRVLAPGGLLLASVQGAFAASYECSPDTLAAVLREGIYDGGRTGEPGQAPEAGEWRGFYLTREYVNREWAPHFEILDYLEAEINADEDLVVARRPAA
jgi:SAM-dependent methyltransferase